MARFVDPARARAHMANLHAAYGISYRTIAHQAGMEIGQLNQIVSTLKTIRWETERRLLRVRFDLEEMPPEAQVDVMGTRRRLQALERLGWSQKEIAARTGILTANLGKLVTGHAQRYVTAAVALRVRDVYDELSLTPGPNLRARLRGERRGYLPPLAWDDDAIDNIYARPADTERKPSPVWLSRDLFEDVCFILDYDPAATTLQVSQRLGVSKDQMLAAFRRHADDLQNQVHAELLHGGQGPLLQDDQAVALQAREPVQKVRDKIAENTERAGFNVGSNHASKEHAA